MVIDTVIGINPFLIPCSKSTAKLQVFAKMDKFSVMAKDLKWKCSAFDGLKSTHYQTIFYPLFKIHCQKGPSLNGLLPSHF